MKKHPDVGSQSSGLKTRPAFGREPVPSGLESSSPQHGPGRSAPHAFRRFAGGVQSSGDVLMLQRTLGNTAVRDMLEPPPPSVRSARIQARRLAVTPVRDPLELEADRLADRALRKAPQVRSARDAGFTAIPSQPASSIDAGPPAFSRPTTHDLSLRGDTGLYAGEGMGAQLEGGSSLHSGDGVGAQLEGGSSGLYAGAHVARQIEGGDHGRPLDARTRGDMESRFDADFGRVRIHTGDSASQLNRELGAQAFTYGPDIYFGSGRYMPETHSGRFLLAHELAHTLQQGASSIQRKADPGATPSITGISGTGPVIQCLRDPAIDPRAGRQRTDLPTSPAIAASYSFDGSHVFGAHAKVFLAMGDAPAMNYYVIDLTNAGDIGVSIAPVNEKGWADQAKSTTWSIDNTRAQRAMDAAEYYRDTWARSAAAKSRDLPTGFFSSRFARAKRYLTREHKYSGWGVGWRRYNCASLAQRILRAAGIRRTAGKIISTPSQLATGKTHRWEMVRMAGRGIGRIVPTSRRNAHPGGHIGAQAPAPQVDDLDPNALALANGGVDLAGGQNLQAEDQPGAGGEADLELAEPGMDQDQPGGQPGMDEEQPGGQPGMDNPGALQQGELEEEDQQEGN